MNQASYEDERSRVRVTIYGWLLDMCREEAKKRNLTLSKFMESCAYRYFGDILCHKDLYRRMHAETLAEKMANAIATEQAQHWNM